MLSKDSAGAPQQFSSLSGPRADAAEVSLLDPQDGIDVASGGDGTTNDPPATDHKPPSGIADLDYLA